MKIVIIGATGRAGSRIAAEALRRGHQVTGVVRNPDPSRAPGVTLMAGDATKPESIVAAIRGQDAVVSATRFTELPAAPLISALRQGGVRRLLVVGGAASLEIAPGKLLLEHPDFPEVYRAEASAGKRFLEDLRATTDLDWTFLSPSADFAPGRRTGKFRLGGDRLLETEKGESAISMEDFAIAALDELERPRHLRRRFTVGY